MPKAPRGRYSGECPDARRKGSRIAISPSVISQIDAIAKHHGKSRADIIEDLVSNDAELALIVDTEKI